MTNSGHNPIPDAGDAAGSGGNIPIDRVEWSRSTILEFIEDYRGFNVLWDPNTKGYHIKQVKYEALKNLSRKYSTEVRVIRSKIKSLRSSFHREHGKVISGKRRGVNYQPMWFAYEAIRFILEGERNEMEGGNSSSFDAVCGNGERQHAVTGDDYNSVANGSSDGGVGGGAAACMVSNGIDANDELATFLKTDQDQDLDPQYINIRAGDVKTEILETTNADSGNLSSAQNYRLKKSLSTKLKRKRSSAKNDVSTYRRQIDSDSDSLASTTCSKRPKGDTSESDEFGVFGEYVGITIRKLRTQKAQIVIKHLINNLLFDAEMGRYDYGIPTSREPPHLYATTD